MSRLLAIDYGKQRVGLAVTDPLRLIAAPLTTLPSSSVIPFLQDYMAGTSVAAMVIGYPLHLSGRSSPMTMTVEQFVRVLKRYFPGVPVFRQDERLTSVIAQQSRLETGTSKKARRSKALLDAVSAALILQSFMTRQEVEQSQLL